MDTKETARALGQNAEILNNAMAQMNKAKDMLMEKMATAEQQNLDINGEPARATITKGATVIIQFVSQEEALKFYKALG